MKYKLTIESDELIDIQLVTKAGDMYSALSDIKNYVRSLHKHEVHEDTNVEAIIEKIYDYIIDSTSDLDV